MELRRYPTSTQYSQLLYPHSEDAAVFALPKLRAPRLAKGTPAVGNTSVVPKPSISTAFVRRVEIKSADLDRRSYPLNLPAFRGVHSLDLDPRMTIFVGENGSGKSTLVEAIAVAAGFNAEGGTINFNFATQRHRPELADHVRLVRGTLRPRTGFFLRAESFFNVATEIERLDEAPSVAARIGPAYGPKLLHEVSHGESFLALAMHRFGPSGLYVLDEPEAAMSPFGCFALLRRFHDLVLQGSQFVIATHSPIMMAFPGALIYVLSESGPRQSKWEDLDHVKVLKEFISHRDVVMAELLTSNKSEPK
jgi:predicted ATPase